MKNTIIIHGTCDKEEYYSDKFPSLSNSHWIPWIQKQMLIKDIECDTPEMINAYNPNYLLWKNKFERYSITEKTTLIGHSCGGGFLLRRLSENKTIKVDKVILIAPGLDPEDEKENNFFEFQFDKDLAIRANKFIIFNSTNDSKDIQKSLEIIKENLKNIKIKNFDNYGHFCFDDLKTDKFPELLNEIL